MASSADLQAQIDSLNAEYNKPFSGGLGSAASRSMIPNKIQALQKQLSSAQQAEDQQRQQQEQQQQQQQDQQRQQDEQRQREEQQRQQEEQQRQQQVQQQQTPISQVAPQTANSQFPTLNQSIIDAQFKNRNTNELTINNSDIRDQIYNAGWNQKSDAVRVLNGAGNYGIVTLPSGVGGGGFRTLNGGVASDKDFLDAANAAGIQNPSQYQRSAGGGLGSRNATVLDQGKIYNLLQEKGKDLYSITNAVEGAAKRGAEALHATVTYKPDGSGNLVPVNNPTTGQPDVKYFNAVNYNNEPSFMDTYGPFLALLPAVGGVLQYAGVLPSFTNAGTAAGGFDAVSGYGSVGPSGFTAANAAGVGAGTIAGMPLNQVGAVTSTMTPAQVAALKTTGDVVEGGALLNGIGMGVGGATLGNQLTNALNTGALVSGIGAGVGALSSYAGSQLQADAAKEATAAQLSMFKTINDQFAPQRGAGYQSLNQIRSMLPGQYTTYGETGKPTGEATGTDYLTRQFTPQDLQAGLAPNYQFMLNQGQNLNQRQANLSGGAISGNTLRGLEDYTQNYAQNAYQGAFNNFQSQRTGIYNTLAGIAGLGQKAQESTSQAGQNATTAAAQLGVGSAAAQAAGLTGASNAIAGGLQNYQQNQILQAVLGQNQNVAQQTPGYYG